MERERRETICLGVLVRTSSDRCRAQKLHWCYEPYSLSDVASDWHGRAIGPAEAFELGREKDDRIEGKSLPDNPRSSAMSVVREILNLASPVVI